MAGRVGEDPPGLARLVVGLDGAERQHLLLGLVKVGHREVEVGLRGAPGSGHTGGTWSGAIWKHSRRPVGERSVTHSGSESYSTVQPVSSP